MSIIKSFKTLLANSTCISYMLGLFFLAIAFTSCALVQKKKVDNNGKVPVEYALTVAAINPPAGNDAYIEVNFDESARFYRIPKNAAPEYLELLRMSEKTNTPVLVKRANEYSDIILRVRKKK
jgi:hypothetical protein